MDKSWGSIDPNTQHQLWSRWRFVVYGPAVELSEVELNAGRWLRQGFGSVGHARVQEQTQNGLVAYVIEAEVEGAPANEVGYVTSVKRNFYRFVRKGWGITAHGSVEVEILAGDRGDGKPPSQLVVMPTIGKV